MDKSYVTLAQKMCIVCDKTYDSGELLLDKRSMLIGEEEESND